MRYLIVLLLTVVLGAAEIVPALADDPAQVCHYLDGTVVHVGPGSCDAVPYWREH